MKETPIGSDPAVLECLYKRFDYLQDLPCDIRGCLIGEAINLGVLETDSFLCFLMAYEVEKQKARRDHFAFLSVEDNLKINRYRHLRPVEPWPQPIIGVSFSGDRQTGVTTGTHKVDVILNNVVALITMVWSNSFTRQRNRCERLTNFLEQFFEFHLPKFTLSARPRATAQRHS